MNVARLIPQPPCSETFKRNRTRFVPEISGCYSLTTFAGEVLYVGLTKNLRRRMEEHLDDETKIGLTPFGRAVRFFWLEHGEREKIERTWMNIHVQHEGRRPILNKVDSPVSS